MSDKPLYRQPRILAQWLKLTGMSRYRFAKEIDVTPSYVTRLCKPAPPLPSREIMRCIAVATDGYIMPNDWAGLPTEIGQRASPISWSHEQRPAPAATPEIKPEPAAKPKPMSTQHLIERVEHKRFITIGQFTCEMMGKRSNNWFYNHLSDPGFPQRIYLPGSGTRPVLDYAECLKFQNSATTAVPWKSKRAPREETQNRVNHAAVKQADGDEILWEVEVEIAGKPMVRQAWAKRPSGARGKVVGLLMKELGMSQQEVWRFPQVVRPGEQRDDSPPRPDYSNAYWNQ